MKFKFFNIAEANKAIDSLEAANTEALKVLGDAQNKLAEVVQSNEVLAAELTSLKQEAAGLRKEKELLTGQLADVQTKLDQANAPMTAVCGQIDKSVANLKLELPAETAPEAKIVAIEQAVVSTMAKLAVKPESLPAAPTVRLTAGDLMGQISALPNNGERQKFFREHRRAFRAALTAQIQNPNPNPE